MTNTPTSYRISQVQEEAFTCISTGDALLDSAFARSSDGTIGLPTMKVGLISGGRGAGKTRFYSRLAVKLAALGRKSLVFQGEMSLGEYKTYLTGICRAEGLDSSILDLIIATESKDYEFHASLIRKHEVAVYFCDSFPMFDGSHRKDTIEEVVGVLKDAIYDVGGYGVIINHLNSEGKEKGNSHLGHMVDQIFLLNARPDLGRGMVSMVADKNRCGEIGEEVLFRHGPDYLFFPEEISASGGDSDGEKPMSEDCPWNHVIPLEIEDWFA